MGFCEVIPLLIEIVPCFRLYLFGCISFFTWLSYPPTSSHTFGSRPPQSQSVISPCLRPTLPSTELRVSHVHAIASLIPALSALSGLGCLSGSDPAALLRAYPLSMSLFSRCFLPDSTSHMSSLLFHVHFAPSSLCFVSNVRLAALLLALSRCVFLGFVSDTGVHWCTNEVFLSQAAKSPLRHLLTPLLPPLWHFSRRSFGSRSGAETFPRALKRLQLDLGQLRRPTMCCFRTHYAASAILERAADPERIAPGN
jgi:hypothetical protein